MVEKDGYFKPFLEYSVVGVLHSVLLNFCFVSYLMFWKNMLLQKMNLFPFSGERVRRYPFTFVFSKELILITRFFHCRMEQIRFLKHCILSEHSMNNKDQKLSNLKRSFYYLIFTCALDYIHLFNLISWIALSLKHMLLIKMHKTNKISMQNTNRISDKGQRQETQ